MEVIGQTEIEMEDDAEKLHGIYKMVLAIKDFRVPAGVSERIGENFEVFKKALDGMNKTRLIRNEHGEFVNNFNQKYVPGEKEEFRIVPALNKKFESLSLGYDVGDEYQTIMFRFSILDTAGEQNAVTALELIKAKGTDPAILRNLHEIYRVKAIEEAQSLLDIAPLFAPGNERIERRIERLRGEIEVTLKDYNTEEQKVLQSRMWKENISNTSAGAPAALAAAGKTFMTGLPDWGGNTSKATKIEKVSIIGDWFVAERNALGMPTRYGLPAAVAVTDNTMSPGVVTVYEVSLVTKEPKRNTDFYGVWVGNVWRMLAKNLPK